MSVFDWTTISRNPVSGDVHAALLEEIELRLKDPICHYPEFLSAFVQERSVLDIGSVEHDLDHAKLPSWRHALLKRHAREITGVDILEKEAEVLRGRGFNILCADATSELDLEVRVERIVIGDVIEHVDSSVNLLKFARRHLLPEGVICVTTPNPFFWKHFQRIFREQTFVSNAEHISWVSPSMAVELARRAQLRLCAIHHLRPPITRFSRRLKRFIADRVFGKQSEFLTSSFVYLFERP